MLSHLLRVPLVGALIPAAALPQVEISGRVVVDSTGAPAPGAVVVLVESAAETSTDAAGAFVFEGVEAGERITVRADLGFLRGQTVFEVHPDSGGRVVLPGPIRLAFPVGPHERVTVTAASGDRSSLARYGAVTLFEGLELLAGAPDLAEVVEGAPGVAIRSLGPGPARPIVRGFDGDRVLVTEDGVLSGDLGSQAAEHGILVDPSRAERIELVRGPATLLFGASAVGGVMNLVSPGSRMARDRTTGWRGRAHFGGGSADGRRAGAVHVATAGDGWFAWGGGSTRRTGDYRSPLGTVSGSATAMDHGDAGLGLRGERAHFAVGVQLDESRFGVPLAGLLHGAEPEGPGEAGETVEVALDRRQLRADLGVEDLGSVFDAAALTVRYSVFTQDEIEREGEGPPALETHHENRSLVLRAELERSEGRLRSRVGAWANLRDFASAGPEALAPDTRHRALAAFALTEFSATDRLALLLAARLAEDSYDARDRPSPDDRDDDEGDDDEGDEGEAGEAGVELEPPAVVDRDFVGPSASAGVRLELGRGSELVATTTISSRAPALEELYNFGLDAGIQAFEIGDPLLQTERARGFDLILRRGGPVFAGSVGVFRYDMAGFTYGAVAAHRSGVTVISTQQADARFLGFETEGSLRLGAADLLASASWVDAWLPDLNRAAPRIPPLNGRVTLELPIGRLRFAPRLRWAARMDRPGLAETPTNAYLAADLAVSWVRLTRTAAHRFSLVGHNLTDAVVRHHTSVIKDLAPQPGRGIRFSYSIRLYQPPRPAGR